MHGRGNIKIMRYTFALLLSNHFYLQNSDFITARRLSIDCSSTLLRKFTQRACGRPQANFSAANSFAALTNNSQPYFQCPRIIKHVCTEHNVELPATEFLDLALLFNTQCPL